MLCPNCGNRMFDDGLDDILYCGACHNYEKRGRVIPSRSLPFSNSTEVIAAYNRSRDSETETITRARQLREPDTEQRERALHVFSLFYSVSPYARGNA